MTGREKINEMSNEEFVKCMSNNAFEGCPASFGLNNYSCIPHNDVPCIECWRKALESEIEE